MKLEQKLRDAQHLISLLQTQVWGNLLNQVEEAARNSNSVSRPPFYPKSNSSPASGACTEKPPTGLPPSSSSPQSMINLHITRIQLLENQLIESKSKSESDTKYFLLKLAQIRRKYRDSKTEAALKIVELEQDNHRKFFS
jgi:hypothetical protein